MIAVEVAIQAAAMVYAIAGLGLWVDQDNGVLTTAFESEESIFPEMGGFMIHGIVVRMRIRNDSGEVHPMHLHGHHAVVLSRDGVEATGSPWWVDSLNVGNGEEYEIALLADNPRVWMDHCHNLPHAAEGLVAHLMYAGYSTPFSAGRTTGNEPE